MKRALPNGASGGFSAIHSNRSQLEFQRASPVSGRLICHLKPTRASDAYYQIDVADNGIGFDEKHLDRISQVFQRLHGKAEFSETVRP